MTLMPITKSAKKALRGSEKKRLFNVNKKELINKAVKKVKKLVAEKKGKEALALMPEVQKILDKSVKTGLLKLNAASRKKSRLVAMIKKAN
ncbi:MAG: SSU ribosomal protein S20p [Parcubacteria bacterium C7867-006]|nr:MAG: SSU ribosomal protein S20p [Parcubacteria bacterium C7867-006]